MFRPRRHSWSSRVTATALAVVLSTVAAAACVSAAARPAQAAGCASMAHTGGDASVEASCCGVESQNVTAVRADALARDQTAVGFLTWLDSIPPPTSTHARASGSSLVKPPGIPTYLFVSSFRI